MDFDRIYASDLELIESALNGCFTDGDAQGLLESMRYSLASGGKRIRPVLTLEFCRACGGDAETALGFAMAVEMLHTYSLIHDDLPCMDDDDMRRGKPSNHIVFGEGHAVLAGDALLTAAFGTLLDSPLPAERLAAAGRELAYAGGPFGMCCGQYLDLLAAGKDSLTEEELLQINRYKTAALITAAARLGVLAGVGGERELELASEYGLNLGLAFQLRDDMLDADSGETSFATLLGAEECMHRIEVHTDRAVKAAMSLKDGEFLAVLAERLAVRDK